jgi:hypothetical protein
LEQRAIIDIAPEELINYMEAITRVSLGISRTELVDTTAKAFGRRSITREVAGHLDSVIGLALERGRLVDDGTITVPKAMNGRMRIDAAKPERPRS